MLDEHRYGRCTEIVPAYAVRYYAGHVEQRTVDILRVGKIVGEGPLGAVALGLRNFGFHG